MSPRSEPHRLLPTAPDSHTATGVGRLVALATALLVLLAAAPTEAETVVHDGDSLVVDGRHYRLDGVDAPELDQVCVGEDGRTWSCGIAARDQLRSFLGGRAPECSPVGPDALRRTAQCQVGGMDVGEWLVREGWAVNFEPAAKGRFLGQQAQARSDRRGLWKGCFIAPDDFRRWSRSKAGLLGDCPVTMTGEKQTRELLFPSQATMPPGCPIKGTVALRAKATGHVGIFHLASCRTYLRTRTVNRWFCSEDDARAAGFRKAINC